MKIKYTDKRKQTIKYGILLSKLVGLVILMCLCLCLCLCLCVCLQGEVLPVGGGAEPAVSGPAAHPAVVQVHHGRRPLLQLLAGGHAYHHLQPVQGKPNGATGPVYPVWVIKPP